MHDAAQAPACERGGGRVTSLLLRMAQDIQRASDAFEDFRIAFLAMAVPAIESFIEATWPFVQMMTVQRMIGGELEGFGFREIEL